MDSLDNTATLGHVYILDITYIKDNKKDIFLWCATVGCLSTSAITRYTSLQCVILWIHQLYLPDKVRSAYLATLRRYIPRF